MNKKASLLVDAAICIPLFLTAMLVLLSLFIQAGKEEKVYHTAVQIALGAQCVQGYQEEVTVPLVAGKALMQLDYRPWISDCSELVYIFPKSGKCYHLKTCSLLKEYKTRYKKVTKMEAEEDGYSPCKLCVGKLNLFNKKD